MGKIKKQAMYEAFLEYKNLPKPEIVHKIAERLGVTTSQVWIALEKTKIVNRDIENIINALKPGRLNKLKAPSIKSNERQLNGRQENISLENKIASEISGMPETIAPKETRHYPKKPSRDELYELYTKKGESIVEIAKRYHRERGTIYVWLREYNIPRKIVSVKRPRALGRPSKELLYKEYIEEKKGISEMAKAHSAGRNTIRRWLIKNEIPLRTASEELLKNKKLPSKEELEELYLKKQISMKKIAEMYKTGKRIIKRLLNNYEIPIRSYEDALSLVALKGKRVPTEEKLNYLYIKEGKSIDEIAKIYGLSHPPITRLLKKYGIKPRTLRQAARVRIKKMKKEQLEKFELEEYNGLRGMVGLFSLAMDDEEAMATARGITWGYLDKLRNLCDTIGEDNILEEIYLISKNGKNKFEPVLLHCLYKASLEIGIKPSEILNARCGEFEALQKAFSNELKKVYIRYTVERTKQQQSQNNRHS